MSNQQFESKRERDLEALEAFVVGNELLLALEAELNSFNLFEAIGQVRREERHSDFLAFLLNPDQPHGLGDTILRRFVQVALSNGARLPGKLRTLDAALFDLREAHVEREWNWVDILVRCDAESFILLVENKVSSEEHSDQLNRYLRLVESSFPGYRVLPVFLTPAGQEATHDQYYQVSYADVHGILAEVLERSTALSSDLQVVIRHYKELLQRHIMTDTKVASLARKIYGRHSRALEIIMEHRPDAHQLLYEKIQTRVRQAEGLRLAYHTAATVHFVPEQWDSIAELAQGGDGTWGGDPSLVRFEFVRNRGLSLHLRIGPGNSTTREKLHRAATRAYKRVFVNHNKKNSDKWTQLWRATIYTSKEAAELSLSEKLERIDTRWEMLSRTKVPELTQAILDITRAF